MTVTNYDQGVPVRINNPYKGIKRLNLSLSSAIEEVLFDDYGFKLEESVLKWTDRDRSTLRGRQERQRLRDEKYADREPVDPSLRLDTAAGTGVGVLRRPRKPIYYQPSYIPCDLSFQSVRTPNYAQQSYAAPTVYATNPSAQNPPATQAQNHPNIPPQNAPLPPQNTSLLPRITGLPSQNTSLPPQNPPLPSQNPLLPPPNSIPISNAYIDPPQNLNQFPPSLYTPSQPFSSNLQHCSAQTTYFSTAETDPEVKGVVMASAHSPQHQLPVTSGAPPPPPPSVLSPYSVPVDPSPRRTPFAATPNGELYASRQDQHQRHPQPRTLQQPQQLPRANPPPTSAVPVVATYADRGALPPYSVGGPATPYAPIVGGANEASVGVLPPPHYSPDAVYRHAASVHQPRYEPRSAAPLSYRPPEALRGPRQTYSARPDIGHSFASYASTEPAYSGAFRRVSEPPPVYSTPVYYQPGGASGTGGDPGGGAGVVNPDAERDNQPPHYNRNNHHNAGGVTTGDAILKPLVLVQSKTSQSTVQPAPSNGVVGKPFDVKDFEKCADAFEDVTLHCINDMQELKSVLSEQQNANYLVNTVQPHSIRSICQDPPPASPTLPCPSAPFADNPNTCIFIEDTQTPPTAQFTTINPTPLMTSPGSATPISYDTPVSTILSKQNPELDTQQFGHTADMCDLAQITNQTGQMTHRTDNTGQMTHRTENTGQMTHRTENTGQITHQTIHENDSQQFCQTSNALSCYTNTSVEVIAATSLPLGNSDISSTIVMNCDNNLAPIDTSTPTTTNPTSSTPNTNSTPSTNTPTTSKPTASIPTSSSATICTTTTTSGTPSTTANPIVSSDSITPPGTAKQTVAVDLKLVPAGCLPIAAPVRPPRRSKTSSSLNSRSASPVSAAQTYAPPNSSSPSANPSPLLSPSAGSATSDRCNRSNGDVPSSSSEPSRSPPTPRVSSSSCAGPSTSSGNRGLPAPHLHNAAAATTFDLSSLDDCLPAYSAASPPDLVDPSPRRPHCSPVQFDGDSEELPGYSVTNPFPGSHNPNEVFSRFLAVYELSVHIIFARPRSDISKLDINLLVTELGVSRQRIEMAITYGRGNRIDKLRGLLKLEDQLLMKGFQLDDIISYFLDVNNTQDNAEKYLTLQLHLRECGFQEEVIVKAIKKSKTLDASQVLDFIYRQ